MVTEERAVKLKNLAAKRQCDFTIVLENVHDPHNLGAVLRSCDSVGVPEIYAIYTKEKPDTLEELIGHKSSSGSKKWVDVHFFDEPEACIRVVKRKYKNVFGTHLGKESKSLYDLNLAGPIALVFGNEHRGISEELLHLLDGNFLIPQMGLVQSLNISVACAVSLYEGLRQRNERGLYDEGYNQNNPKHNELYQKYLQNSKVRKEE